MIAGLTTRSYGNEEFLFVENVHDFLLQNPQIKKVELLWLWEFKARLDVETYDIVYRGTTIDYEYTIIGTREEVIEKLDNYDCWDESILFDYDHPRRGMNIYGLDIIGDTLHGLNDPNPFGDIEWDDELPSDIYEVTAKVVPHFRKKVRE